MPQDTNIYQYQKAKQFEFPIISKIAKNYFPISATSALSEYIFSTSSNIVTKKQNSITEDSVQMIVCLKAQSIVQNRNLVDERDQ